MRPSTRTVGAVLLFSLLAGCVPVPPELMPVPTGGSTIVKAVFPGLDPGAAKEQGLHFMVNAYGPDKAKELSAWAEDAYAKIMQDTGLYSFKPAGLYEFVVYATPDEYRKKTQQPEWSGGVTVGNSIYAYEGPQLRSTLAHEMTHLVFNEYMGDIGKNFRWLNEGLAVYEEAQAGAAPERAQWDGRMNQSKLAPLPFDQMVNLIPATERERIVSQWYPQVGSLVRYIIARGGALGFSQFLGNLKSGQAIAASLTASYPGMWSGLPALEEDWKRSS